MKVELIDKHIRLLKTALINFHSVGEFNNQFFGEEINCLCFDRINLFLIVGTSKGSVLVIDSKSGKLLGAQRIFIMQPVISIQMDSALNLLYLVSREQIKVLKIGFVSFDNQRMNRVMRQNWGYFL